MGVARGMLDTGGVAVRSGMEKKPPARLCTLFTCVAGGVCEHGASAGKVHGAGGVVWLTPVGAVQLLVHPL